MNETLVQIPEQFQRALALHQSGRLTQAQAIYEEILQIQPPHLDAFYLLGAIALQGSNPQKAVELFGNAEAHANCGNALAQMQRLDAALANYEWAIALKADGASGILQFSDDMDFIGTAALCKCLELVISVDTGLAHLSGALGRNTWALVWSMPDWRWLMNRDDSPWNPSIRLYRQQGENGWSGVLKRVGSDLIQQLKNTSPA